MISITEQERATRSAETMLANDPASRRLGMALDEIRPGYARMSMRVVGDMLNGSCHGGYLFTFGDSAFAFACNTFNQVAVASSASIEFLAPAFLDDELTAECSLQSQGKRTGLYDVVITNQHDKRVALFRGRSHRLGRTLFDEDSDGSESVKPEVNQQ